MNILRPLSPHLPILKSQRIRLISFLFLLIIFFFLYLISKELGLKDYFMDTVSHGATLFGSRALSALLIKMGCPGSVCFICFWGVRALLTPFMANANMVLPTGADAEASTSTSFPKLEWELALDLPAEQKAPEPLRAHVEGELRILMNIGRKRTLPDSTFYERIEPLALDKATVGFCKNLLGRVDELQVAHYNRGNHIFFKFDTKEQKERLYSVMWDNET